MSEAQATSQDYTGDPTQQQEQPSYGHQQAQQSSYDPAQTQTALAGMYSVLQQLSEDYGQTRSQLAALLEENARVAQARNPHLSEMPPIEDYDKTLNSIIKDHQETRQAMASLVGLLQNYFQTTDTQQREQQARIEQEEMAATYQYVQQTAADLDKELESQGYPGFFQYKALVKEAIFNAPGWSSDPTTLQQQINLINDPAFWGYVYINHVFPLLERQGNRARYASPAREAFAASVGGDNWDTDDYLALRGQHNQIITR